jgi:NhaA family Na+:H+ antiporter
LRPRIFVPSRVIQAAQAFIQVEAASGIALLLAALVALVWANSPGKESYHDLWATEIALDAGLFQLKADLRHAVNDGLMALFFFVMGLEIKRELVHGELSDARRALLPAAAAFGGMALPALIFTALNFGGEGARGWGIPMATDIAFALGVLSLLGRRVPFSMKVFLLALAIADDIGAIVVIAVFYTGDLDPVHLALAAALLGTVIAMNRSGVRNVDVYVAFGLALWFAVYQSGVHATLAGVVLGLLTPARAFYDPAAFSHAAHELAERFSRAIQGASEDERQGVLAQMEDLSHGTEAALDRLARKLHSWVSFGVVPLFALANAGVSVSGDTLTAASSSPVTLGILCGLVIGKPAGITLLVWLAVKLRLCQLPSGAAWSHVVGVGMLGGIGFTVSLLIGALAYEDGGLIGEAKLGVLAASLTAGVAGFAFLWLNGARESPRAH